MGYHVCGRDIDEQRMLQEEREVTIASSSSDDSHGLCQDCDDGLYSKYTIRKEKIDEAS